MQSACVSKSLTRSVDWRAELDELFDEDERRQTISAVVGIRNQIAHGENQGVSIRRLHDYRRSVDRIVDFSLTSSRRSRGVPRPLLHPTRCRWNNIDVRRSVSGCATQHAVQRSWRSDSRRPYGIADGFGQLLAGHLRRPRC